MSRVLLLVPTATYRAADFVEAARSLGVSVVLVSDRDVPFPGEHVEQHVIVDLRESDAAQVIVERLGETPIDAVVGIDDGAVVAAAETARLLGIPHASPEAVAATRDKLVMREELARAGVAQPPFAAASAVDDAQVAAVGLGFPVVVKPRTLSASRGVIRADDSSELDAAWGRCLAITEASGGEPPLLIERFVPGREVAIEALVIGGDVEILAVFDKPDALDGPFFEETIYVTPSRAEDSPELRGIVEAAVAGLGIGAGPVHAEVRFGPDGPVMIEVAARSIGGLCSRALTFGLLGGSLEEQILRAALGMTRRGMRRSGRATGVMMLPTPAEGVLEGVRHTEALSEVDGITGHEVTVTNGRWVRPLPEGDRYLGFVFAEGETPADVEGSLRDAFDLLDIRIDPDGTPTAEPDRC